MKHSVLPDPVPLATTSERGGDCDSNFHAAT